MDSQRFDTLAKTLSATDTRRGVLAALLSGALSLRGLSQPAVGRKRRGERAVTIQGPCGDGSGPANLCERPADCCTKICEPTQPGKVKRCRCRRRDQPCTRSRNCCQAAGQDLVCDGGTCQPSCPGLNAPCTAAPGTKCCPDDDPNIVCAGGRTSDLVCQDCTRAPKAAGALCQDPTPGNQCCGGSPTCFVGVRVADNQPACYSDGVCRDPGDQCSQDADCGGALECVNGSSNCACSTDPNDPNEKPTYCGTPCS